MGCDQVEALAARLEAVSDTLSKEKAKRRSVEQEIKDLLAAKVTRTSTRTANTHVLCVLHIVASCTAGVHMCRCAVLLQSPEGSYCAYNVIAVIAACMQHNSVTYASLTCSCCVHSKLDLVQSHVSAVSVSNSSRCGFGMCRLEHQNSCREC
jgi:hypothetical protein